MIKPGHAIAYPRPICQYGMNGYGVEICQALMVDNENICVSDRDGTINVISIRNYNDILIEAVTAMTIDIESIKRTIVNINDRSFADD